LFLVKMQGGNRSHFPLHRA